MRVNLNAFQENAYAELRDKATWGLSKKLAKYQGSTNEAEDKSQLATDLLSGLVKEWNVKDVDGQDVPIPSKATEEQMDMIDAMIISEILKNATKPTEVAVDPNSETDSSTS